MCNHKLKHDYFEWLCDLINVNTDTTSYWLLARDLFSKEFYSLVKHDENRGFDGLDLREEYCLIYNEYEEDVCDSECTILEMLIALARRMNDEMYNPESGKNYTSRYFWEMINNLGLSLYSDDVYVELDGSFNCDNILTSFLDREYNQYGEGGLFPLNHPKEDQRKVEIWYQMQEYLKERYDR